MWVVAGTPKRDCTPAWSFICPLQSGESRSSGPSARLQEKQVTQVTGVTLRDCSLRVGAVWVCGRPRQTAVRTAFPITRKESYVTRARQHERQRCATAHALHQTHTVSHSLTHSMCFTCHSATRHEQAHKPCMCACAATAVFCCQCAQGSQALPFPSLVPTRYATWRTITSLAPMMPQDAVFRRALMALPQPLRVALTEAELDDPGLFLAYPRATAAQLGFDHAPPSDQRRRHTKKGGGGGGVAEAAAATDTAVGQLVALFPYRLSPVPSRSFLLRFSLHLPLFHPLFLTCQQRGRPKTG